MLKYYVEANNQNRMYKDINSIFNKLLFYCIILCNVVIVINIVSDAGGLLWKLLSLLWIDACGRWRWPCSDG